jgi:hypothetical protein
MEMIIGFVANKFIPGVSVLNNNSIKSVLGPRVCEDAATKTKIFPSENRNLALYPNGNILEISVYKVSAYFL